MTRPSIVLCTSSFWPDVDEAAWWAADFCKSLAKKNLNALVFAPRVVRSNPAQFEFHGSHVYRIFHSQWPQLGQYQYWREISEVISKRGIPELGFVIADNAAQTIGALQTARKFKAPSVVKIGSSWIQDTVKLKTIRRISNLDQSSVHLFRCVASDLAGAEISSLRFKLKETPNLISDGVAFSPQFFANERDKIALRKALARTHVILDVDPKQPLVLCLDSLQQHRGIVQLVQAWKQIQDRFPLGRLWISSPLQPSLSKNANEIWNTILRNDLNNEVIMPGLFDVRDDLMYAADLMVCTNPVEPMNRRLIKKAMGCGLPVLSAAHPCLNGLLDQKQTGWCYDSKDPNELLHVLSSLIEDPTTAKTVCDRAKTLVANIHDFDETVSRYLGLF